MNEVGVAVLILLTGLVGANLYVMYCTGTEIKGLREEVRHLNEGVDGLRLTSRTRIGTIKPGLGAHAKERQGLVRLGRASRLKRVLVGGDQDYEELRELPSAAPPADKPEGVEDE